MIDPPDAEAALRRLAQLVRQDDQKREALKTAIHRLLEHRHLPHDLAPEIELAIFLAIHDHECRQRFELAEKRFNERAQSYEAKRPLSNNALLFAAREQPMTITSRLPSKTTLRLLVFATFGMLIASASWAQDETRVKVITKDNDATKVRVKVIANIPATLQPDVLHGFTLGNSSIDRAYVIEITPITLLSSADDGASIESFVEPEFNGPTRTWIDVVRVLLRNASASVGANIRVYALVPLLKKDKNY